MFKIPNIPGIPNLSIMVLAVVPFQRTNSGLFFHLNEYILRCIRMLGLIPLHVVNFFLFVLIKETIDPVYP